MLYMSPWLIEPLWKSEKLKFKIQIYFSIFNYHIILRFTLAIQSLFRYIKQETKKKHDYQNFKENQNGNCLPAQGGRNR